MFRQLSRGHGRVLRSQFQMANEDPSSILIIGTLGALIITESRSYEPSGISSNRWLVFPRLYITFAYRVPIQDYKYLQCVCSKSTLENVTLQKTVLFPLEIFAVNYNLPTTYHLKVLSLFVSSNWISRISAFFNFMLFSICANFFFLFWREALKESCHFYDQ